MGNIFDGTGKFIGQNNLGWTFTFEANGKYPIIANRIFETYAEASTFIASATAIPGLLLRVVADSSAGRNGVYLVTADSSDNLSMEKIAKNKINVEQIASWAVYDEETQTWTDVEEGTPGALKVVKLTVGDTVSYLSADTILDSYHYATEDFVNSSVSALNSSVQQNIDNVSAGIHTEIDNVSIALNQSMTEIDTRVNARIADTSAYMVDVSQRLGDLRTTVIDLSSYLDTRLDGIDTRIDTIDNLYVSDVSTNVIGDFLMMDTEVSRDASNPSTGKLIDISARLVTQVLRNASEGADGLATALDTKNYILSKLKAIHSFEYTIIESLDDIPVDESGMWKIYLIRTEDKAYTRAENDLYDEYIVIAEEDIYHSEPNYRIELLGNTSFDLTPLNTSIALLDASVRRINGSINDINSSLDRINSSIDDLSNYLTNEIVHSIAVDSSNAFVSLTNHDVSRGDVRVTVDVSLIEQYDHSQNTIDGVATAGYVESRLSWDSF